MIEHRLFILLKSFSEEEIKKFGEFILSPYFNHNKTIISFYEIIRKYYPSFSNKLLSNEIIFKKLWTDKQYHDSTIRFILSETNRLALNFLKTEELNTDILKSSNFILHCLISRDQYEQAHKIIDEINRNKKLNDKTGLSELQDLLTFQTNAIDYDIKSKIIESNLDKKIIEERINKINDSIINLNILSIAENISRALKIRFYEHKYNVKTGTDFHDKILDLIQPEKLSVLINKKSKKGFLIKLYMILLKSFKEFENEKLYDVYKRMLRNYEYRLSKDEAAYHYGMLNTYCAVKFNSYKGSRNFKKELLKNYMHILRNGYYKSENIKYLQSSFYRGVLFLAISVKAYRLAEKIIDEYTGELKKEDRAVMKNFALAHLNYERNNFDEALKFIKKIPDDNFIYKYDRYVLKSRIYYELYYKYEECLEHLQNFSNFLNKNTLESEERKTAHIKFIYYLRKLVEFKLDIEDVMTSESKIDLGLIKIQLSKEKNILLKNWLLEKLDLLIKQYSDVI